MERDMKELLVEYVSGNLSGELEDYVRNQIEQNEAYQQEYTQLKSILNVYQTLRTEEPSPQLKENFQSFLNTEMKLERNKDRSGISWLKIAASLVLVAGVAATLWFTDFKRDGGLFSSELAITKTAMMELMTKSSASTRLEAVNSSLEIKEMDDEILNALFYTLNSDENTNVRLAALNALANFLDEEPVRKGIIESLKTQDNPGVQIALINLLVEIRELEAIQPLEDLLERDQVEDFVKEEAQLGIYKLS